MNSLTHRQNQFIENCMKTANYRELRINTKNPEIFDLSSNDYLRLSNHPQVIESIIKAAHRYGSSTSGSPLVNGYLAIHKELEEHLCHWLNFKSALLWCSGCMANESLITTLFNKDDCIIADKSIHNSCLRGIQLSGSKLLRFQHSNSDDLENKLKLASLTNKVIAVITEGIFSMEGNSSDLKQIAFLKSKYNFIWIIDEAHSLGWIGTQGKGSAYDQNVLDQVDILVGTLGKSLASQGAFTLFRSQKIRDFIINACTDFRYSTYLAPSLVAASISALQIIYSIPETERTNWQLQSQKIHQLISPHAKKTLSGPIIPILIGSESSALQAQSILYSHNIKTIAIRYPSVPKNQAILRLSLNRSLPWNSLHINLTAALTHLNNEALFMH